VKTSRVLRIAALIGVLLLVSSALVACDSRTRAAPANSLTSAVSSSLLSSPPQSSSAPVPPVVATTTPLSSAVPPLSPPSPAVPSSSAQPPAHQLQLDFGGTTILPGHRLVAEYGVAGGPGLGVLGAGTATQAAAAVATRAAGYSLYGTPVVGAMELIATVALAGPGVTGEYTSIPNLATIATYLAAAKAAHQLLILDFQPGRASFLEQVKQVRSLLLDPNVSVALDPEWKVGPTQRPGNGLIGSARAADINAVGTYLSQLIKANGLPQKLLVVHQFALSMLPDRSAIKTAPGLAVLFHADGEGSVSGKLNTYHALAFPPPPFYAGFKVFLTQDQRVMNVAEVMKLPRVPDLITYQ
jgi:hypothetical protein